MIKYSLRNKVALSFSLLTTITALLLGTLFYNYSTHQLYHDADTVLDSRARDINTFSSIHRERFDPNLGEAPVIINLLSANNIEIDELPLKPNPEKKEERNSDPTHIGELIPPYITPDKIVIDHKIFSNLIAKKGKISYFNQKSSKVIWRVEFLSLKGTNDYLLLGRNITATIETIGAMKEVFLLFTLILILLSWLIGYQISKRSMKDLESIARQISLIKGANDLNQHISVISKDEVGYLAKEFNLMIESLSNALKKERALIEDASHELKTPITSIITNSQLLSHKLPKTQRDSVIKAIKEESLALNTILNQILELSISEVPKLELLDIKELFGELLNFWQSRGVALSFSGAGSLRSNKSLLLVLLNNLIENANKFAPGSVITITYEVINDEYALSVRDVGKGVAPSDLDHIFDRFYRSKNAQYTLGSGLGLSIVDSLAKRLGAVCFAENLKYGFIIGIKGKREHKPPLFK